MKIRNGFVSNSSSSSFVLVGATIERDDISEEFMKKALDKEGIDVKYDDVEDTFWDSMYSGKFELENPSETDAWGIRLFSFDDDYIEESETSFQEVIDAGEKAKEKLTEFFGYTPEIKIITGTEMC